MLNSFFKNEEFRSITYRFIILQIIILLGCYFIFISGINGLNRKYIEHNKVIAARLIAMDTSAKEDIIKVFIKDVSAEEIKASETELDDYGYNSNLDVYKNPVIYRYQNHTAFVMVCLLLSAGVAAYLLTIRKLLNIFNKIKEFSRAAEQIVEGKFEKNFPDNREGDFYIFGHQFNMMSKRLKESLDKLKEEKLYLKNIIADISHQLKTPLAALVMFNSIMESDENMEWTERENFLKKSAEQLSKMEWLIKNLLKLARLEAGAVEFKLEDNKLSSTIDKSVTFLELMAEEKEQSVIVKGDSEIMLSHDSEWTAEALINLIKNSIEHTQKGGKIEIETEETPLSVQIIIKDNGEGISQSELPKIFKRFYKGENSTNPSSIGIGLALSKSIIEGQRGSITAQSEVGKGTVFYITFLKTVI